MSKQNRQSAFPIVRTTAAMLLATGALIPLSIFAVRFFVGYEQAVRSSTFAAIVVGGLALMSLAAVAVVGRRGVMPTVYAWFIAALIRLPACLIAAMWAQSTKLLEPKPMVVALAVFYVPLLLIEAGFVGRYLWRKDTSAQTSTPSVEVTA